MWLEIILLILIKATFAWYIILLFWSYLLSAPICHGPLRTAMLNYVSFCTLHWRHNECDDVSNQRPPDCLLNLLYRHRWKKTSKLRVTSLCAGNSPVTGEFPAQRASSAKNISIWWRHHEALPNPYQWVWIPDRWLGWWTRIFGLVIKGQVRGQKDPRFHCITNSIRFLRKCWEFRTIVYRETKYTCHCKIIFSSIFIYIRKMIVNSLNDLKKQASAIAFNRALCMCSTVWCFSVWREALKTTSSLFLWLCALACRDAITYHQQVRPETYSRTIYQNI